MAAPSPDLIQDITTRFVFTAPEEQLNNIESLMFFVEQAHWYYEDHVREQNPALRSYSLRQFTELVFSTCPELQHHNPDLDDILNAFKNFKRNVPVMGAIMLDKSMERVLLVKGWKSAAGWGFPKGKINKGESAMECAAREVLEETGYDLEGQLREEDVIDLVVGGKQHKLYIVAGVDPESAKFAPKCKGEIGGYAWHRIADLPATKDEGAQTYVSEGGARHKFFMVWPFLRPLKRWINKRRSQVPDWDMPGGHQPLAAAAPPRATPPWSQGASQGGGAAGSGGGLIRHSSGGEQEGGQQQQQQQQRGGAQAAQPPASASGSANPLALLFANATSKALVGGARPAQQQQPQRQQQQQPVTAPAGNAAQIAALGRHEGSAPSLGGAGAPLPLSAFRFDVAAILRALEVPVS